MGVIFARAVEERVIVGEHGVRVEVWCHAHGLAPLVLWEPTELCAPVYTGRGPFCAHDPGQ